MLNSDRSFIKYALRARRWYPFVSRRVAAKQAVAYAKAIAYLGDRWILAKQIRRKEQVIVESNAYQPERGQS